MAKPRIFVSSTYYDLKNIRADLERFIKDQGYEPVLNEKGHIPYGSQEKLEEYCYKEIELCDILVSIIGGRFGSESRESQYSISNLELKNAIDLGRQIYIFVEKSVLSEYTTYKVNQENAEMNYASVDDVRVFKFLDEVYSLQLNNQIHPFETIYDITPYLKEQWSGLFQRLLSESYKQKEVNLLNNIETTAKTLNQLVNYLIEERQQGDQAIKDILLSNHPAFDEIRQKMNIAHRIIFQNKTELSHLLAAYQYVLEVPFGEEWSVQNMISWKNKRGMVLRVSSEIFDEEEKLKIFTPAEWQSEWIEFQTLEPVKEDVLF